jgi:hypothetical protein
MATVNVRQHKNVNHDQEDNVYYNVRIYNDTENPSIPASFSENRTVPILENPSDYELAVERFKVPASIIPIFLWKPDNKFFITLSFDGVDVEKQPQFVPNGSYPGDIQFSFQDAIWSYQQFVDILNNAFSEAFTDLKALKPLAPQTEPPVMTYNAVTELFTITTETSYDITSATPMFITFSYDLYALFPAFYANPINVPPPVTTNKFITLIVKDYNNNTITIGGNDYFQFQQEYTTLALLNDFVSIVFESDTIPIEPEYLSSQTNVTRRIVTDFEPLDGVNDHQAFQYYPQGPLRYYDLKSSYPLSRIGLKVYWTDRTGRAYQLFVNRGDLLTVKLRFRKKSKKIMERVLSSLEEENV